MSAGVPRLETLPVPELEQDGLLLRPWRDDDAATVREMAQEPVSRQWSASLRTVVTDEDALGWIRRRRGAGRVDWAVCDVTTGDVVGRAGLHGIGDDGRNAEIGYGVLAGRRRAGVASRAVAAASAYAFGPLALTRLSLIHAVGNPASCAVATRCGFAYEGTERAALDHGDGVLHDAHRHARLATDVGGRVAPPPQAPPAIEPVEIAAGRVQLRPPSPADAEDALLMLGDPGVARWNPGPGTLDLDEARAWCARGADWSSGTHATFAVLDATSGRLLGNVSLHRIDRAQRDAEIGYRVAPWARGQNVASGAVAAASRWAFGALDLVRIELAHAIENPASCRVAEKADFLLEGTLRQAFVYGDGQRYDEHLHARLVTD